MTKALEMAIEKVRRLPPDRQDLAAEMLEDLASSADVHVLSDEERRLVQEGLDELNRGEYASEEDVQKVLAKYGA